MSRFGRGGHRGITEDAYDLPDYDLDGLGQEPTPCPPCEGDLPRSVAHPYQTGASYIFSIAISIAWIIGSGIGISYLRKLKTARKRRSR